MTRKKVAYISNESARKATFKKRKKGLMKKASELSTLCDINACAIIYSPYETQPELFLSAAGVHRVLARFRRIPVMDQSKNMVNQEGFLRQRIDKAIEQLKKISKENREKEMTPVIFSSLTGHMTLQGLSVMDLNDLSWLIDQILKDIQKKKIENMAKSTTTITTRSVWMAAEAAAVAAVEPPRRGGESTNAALAAANATAVTATRGGQVNVENNGMQPHPQGQDNHQDQQVEFGVEEMILPFEDSNNWFNGFFH